MSCEHCLHCRDEARTQQNDTNIHPLGTRLNHPAHGAVVYWRNDMDRNGAPGRGHYVYKADDPDRRLFYVWGDEFTVATVDIDLPASLVEFLADDQSAQDELTALADSRRPFRRGMRITLAHGKLLDLLRLIYWVRDMADSAPRAARQGAGRVAERIAAASA